MSINQYESLSNNMQHNVCYHVYNTKTVDTQAFWNSTLDNKTASQWIEHWRRLDEQHNNQKKVSRNRVR